MVVVVVAVVVVGVAVGVWGGVVEVAVEVAVAVVVVVVVVAVVVVRHLPACRSPLLPPLLLLLARVPSPFGGAGCPPATQRATVTGSIPVGCQL